jgi:NAD(P)-dependent dehydrogenase (short-subunit alcohol dehydrogenase family)
VAIITGAGRGVGRAYALLIVQHGAKIIVNDLGSACDGRGGDASAGKQVDKKIVAASGQGVLKTADVAEGTSAAAVIPQAVDTIGRLDILINDGILRDKPLIHPSEEDWDTVIRVHLRGALLPMHHTGKCRRLQGKAGHAIEARVINTTSLSRTFGNLGQSNLRCRQGRHRGPQHRRRGRTPASRCDGHRGFAAPRYASDRRPGAMDTGADRAPRPGLGCDAVDLAVKRGVEGNFRPRIRGLGRWIQRGCVSTSAPHGGCCALKAAMP